MNIKKIFPLLILAASAPAHAEGWWDNTLDKVIEFFRPTPKPILTPKTEMSTQTDDPSVGQVRIPRPWKSSNDTDPVKEENTPPLENAKDFEEGGKNQFNSLAQAYDEEASDTASTSAGSQSDLTDFEDHDLTQDTVDMLGENKIFPAVVSEAPREAGLSRAVQVNQLEIDHLGKILELEQETLKRKVAAEDAQEVILGLQKTLTDHLTENDTKIKDKDQKIKEFQEEIDQMKEINQDLIKRMEKTEKDFQTDLNLKKGEIKGIKEEATALLQSALDAKDKMMSEAEKNLRKALEKVKFLESEVKERDEDFQQALRDKAQENAQLAKSLEGEVVRLTEEKKNVEEEATELRASLKRSQEDFQSCQEIAGGYSREESEALQKGGTFERSDGALVMTAETADKIMAKLSAFENHNPESWGGARGKEPISSGGFLKGAI